MGNPMNSDDDDDDDIHAMQNNNNNPFNQYASIDLTSPSLASQLIVNSNSNNQVRNSIFDLTEEASDNDNNQNEHKQQEQEQKVDNDATDSDEIQILELSDNDEIQILNRSPSPAMTSNNKLSIYSNLNDIDNKNKNEDVMITKIKK